MWGRFQQRLQKPIHSKFEKATVLAASISLPIGIYYVSTTLDKRYQQSFNAAAKQKWLEAKVQSSVGLLSFLAGAAMIYAGSKEFLPVWKKTNSIRKFVSQAFVFGLYGVVAAIPLNFSHYMLKEGKESFQAIQQIARENQEIVLKNEKYEKDRIYRDIRYLDGRMDKIEEHLKNVKEKLSQSWF